MESNDVPAPRWALLGTSKVDEWLFPRCELVVRERVLGWMGALGMAETRS